MTAKQKFLTGVGVTIAVSLALALFQSTARADVYNPHPTPPANSVTAAMLQSGIIADVAVGNSAAIQLFKLGAASDGFTVPFSNGTHIATSSSFTFDGTNSILYVTKLYTSNASTTLNKVTYQFPSSQGGASTVLQNDGSGNLSWSTAANSYMQQSYTAGEAISAGEAVFMASTTWNVSSVSTRGGSADGKLGDVATDTMIAMQVSSAVNGTMSTFHWLGAKSGAPADNVVVKLESDSAGAPSGTVLSTGSIAGGTISLSFTGYDFALSPTVNITAGTKYWIVMSRSGANDASNYYLWWGSGNSNCVAAGYIMDTYNGSAWTSYAGCIGDTVKFDSTPYTIYGASAGNPNAMYWIGMAKTAISSGASGYIYIGGEVPGFTGLATSTGYYLANATGTIATSPGTNTRKICFATSASTCLINSNW